MIIINLLSDHFHDFKSFIARPLKTEVLIEWREKLVESFFVPEVVFMILITNESFETKRLRKDQPEIVERHLVVRTVVEYDSSKGITL